MPDNSDDIIKNDALTQSEENFENTGFDAEEEINVIQLTNQENKKPVVTTESAWPEEIKRYRYKTLEKEMLRNCLYSEALLVVGIACAATALLLTTMTALPLLISMIPLLPAIAIVAMSVKKIFSYAKEDLKVYQKHSELGIYTLYANNNENKALQKQKNSIIEKNIQDWEDNSLWETEDYRSYWVSKYNEEQNKKNKGILSCIPSFS